VKWENNCGNKVDDSLRTFLFALRNPRGIPSRTFTLKAGKQQSAVYCTSTCCAAFGDIFVHNDYNKNSHIRTGNWRSNSASANDTACEGFLRGAEWFTVKEIEAFEIAD
jgi:hypothetical protein